jgi:hypothetical protein
LRFVKYYRNELFRKRSFWLAGDCRPKIERRGTCTNTVGGFERENLYAEFQKDCFQPTRDPTGWMSVAWTPNAEARRNHEVFSDPITNCLPLIPLTCEIQVSAKISPPFPLQSWSMMLLADFLTTSHRG